MWIRAVPTPLLAVPGLLSEKPPRRVVKPEFYLRWSESARNAWKKKKEARLELEAAWMRWYTGTNLYQI